MEAEVCAGGFTEGGRGWGECGSGWGEGGAGWGGGEVICMGGGGCIEVIWVFFFCYGKGGLGGAVCERAEAVGKGDGIIVDKMCVADR